MSEHSPLTDAELRAIGDRIDTTPGTGPALTWTSEARLLGEALRLRNENGSLSDQLDQVHQRLAVTTEAFESCKSRHRDYVDASKAYTARAEAPSRRDLLVAEEVMRAAQVGQHKAEIERDALAARVEAATELHRAFDHKGVRYCVECSDTYPDSPRGWILQPCETRRALGLDTERGETDES